LKPLLDMLADATRVLRGAAWNRHAAGGGPTLQAADKTSGDDPPS
jgi:hypothetical protein